MTGHYDLKLMAADDWLETISATRAADRGRRITDRLVVLRHLEKYIGRLTACGERYQTTTHLILEQKRLEAALVAVKDIQAGLFG